MGKSRKEICLCPYKNDNVTINVQIYSTRGFYKEWPSCNEATSCAAKLCPLGFKGEMNNDQNRKQK